MDFRRYESDYWNINYPSDWEAELFKGGVSFLDDENGVGALQISGYIKNENITLKDINELIEDEVPANSILKKITSRKI